MVIVSSHRDIDINKYLTKKYINIHYMTFLFSLLPFCCVSPSFNVLGYSFSFNLLFLHLCLSQCSLFLLFVMVFTSCVSMLAIIYLLLLYYYINILNILNYILYYMLYMLLYIFILYHISYVVLSSHLIITNFNKQRFQNPFNYCFNLMLN